MKTFKNLSMWIALAAACLGSSAAQDTAACKSTLVYNTKTYETIVCMDSYKRATKVFFKSKKDGAEWKSMTSDELQMMGYSLRPNGLMDASDSLEPFYKISNYDVSSTGGALLTNIYSMSQTLNSPSQQQAN